MVGGFFKVVKLGSSLKDFLGSLLKKKKSFKDFLGSLLKRRNIIVFFAGTQRRHFVWF